MHKVVEATKEFLKSDIPDFRSGDTVAVDVRVREGSKERVQRYEGVVISRHGGTSLDATFTVRKVANGFGVERIFPLHSPMLASINVKRRGKVRRAKLNYLKNIIGSKQPVSKKNGSCLCKIIEAPPEANVCGRGFLL